MAYQVLARKWRPKTFADVVGQGPIVQSLKNAVTNGTVGHAYLLSGTRGVGKTTIARIFAKTLRCENRTDSFDPCGECSSCLEVDQGQSLNVLEIDAASKNSVVDIRELISQVATLPSTGQYKIYIIDEVHMLSSSAFNALLKTLEEPPEHALFLLATTEPEKILDTVLSRCQRFEFRPAQQSDLEGHIKNIGQREEISFESDLIITKLCSQGRGSYRDTLSLLDQVLCYAPDRFISDEILTLALGVPQSEHIGKVIQSVLNGDVENLEKYFVSMMDKNVLIDNFCHGLLDGFFIIATSNNKMTEFGVSPSDLQAFSKSELFWIFETLAKDFEWAIKSMVADKTVQIILRKVCLRREILGSKTDSGQTEGDSEPKFEPPRENSAKEKSAKKNEDSPFLSSLAESLREGKAETVIIPEEVEADTVEKEVLVEEEKVVEEVRTTPEEEKNWVGFLQYLKEHSMSRASNLEQGNVLEEINIQAETLRVRIGFSGSGKVFYDYLSQPENSNKLSEDLGQYFGKQVENIDLQFVILSKDEKEETGFTSVVEEEENIEKEILQNREEDFRSNPLILEAQKIFNADLDRVVLE